MKRYILFAGDYYYPEGGVYDLVGSSDTVIEAKETHEKFLSDIGGDWAHILDIKTGECLHHFWRGKWINKNIIDDIDIDDFD